MALALASETVEDVSFPESVAEASLSDVFASLESEVPDVLEDDEEGLPLESAEEAFLSPHPVKTERPKVKVVTNNSTLNFFLIFISPFELVFAALFALHYLHCHIIAFFLCVYKNVVEKTREIFYSYNTVLYDLIVRQGEVRL